MEQENNDLINEIKENFKLSNEETLLVCEYFQDKVMVNKSVFLEFVGVAKKFIPMDTMLNLVKKLGENNQKLLAILT
ncbi:MAG: hypothetical protein HQK78_03210 [Desulfobacterales bacterium]|nr:hypothetical protein [Desulfobacterales bacterium]